MSHRIGSRRQPTWVLIVSATCLLVTAEARSDSGKDRGPRFERDIVPIFRAYCWRCHGSEARVANLDLRTFPLVMRGGNSGAAIVRGSSEQSLLFRKFADLQKHPPENSRPTD